LYKIWQVGQNVETGFAIPKIVAVALSPHEMWNELFYQHTGKEKACHDPIGMCGFKEPDVIDLLDLTGSAPTLDPAPVFAQIKDLNNLSDRRLSALRKHGLDFILRGGAAAEWGGSTGIQGCSHSKRGN